MEEDQGYVGEAEPGSELTRWWHINRLWRLAAKMPVELVPVTALEYLLAEEPWQSSTKKDLALRARRICNANLDCPIILAESGWLMDGSHRLMKAYALEQSHIKAVRFATNPEPDYRATHEEMTQIMQQQRANTTA